MSREREQTRPKSKFKRQANFTEADIKQRLIGFKEVRNKDFSVLKPGMTCRYWTKRDGKKMFRMGGLLIYIDTKQGFLRLKNPSVGKTGLPWSVQLNDVIKLYYKDRVKENEEKAKTSDDVTKLMKKYKVTLQHIEDVLNAFSGENGIDKNLDIIYDKYDARIENVFKELKKLKKRG